MDQVRIGKFIAKRREHKKINQTELAKKLGVTNKAISKWENGRGMPDYSLFKPLCKELDISVSELLNGELDTKSKQNKEDAITNYISYKETKHKKKNIILIAIIIITILISTLLIYFVNSYKKITIYELSGESENFKYENGLLVKSNIKTIIELGNLTSHTIDENQILGQTLSVKIDNEYYFISNIKEGEVISENYGYGEYLDDIKLKYIPQELYIIIWYRTEDEIKTEILKVTNEQLLINDKFIYKKQDSIDSESVSEPINKDKYNKVEICENYYTNIGLKKENNLFVKELNKDEIIKFSCYSSKGDFVYELKNDHIKIKSYGYQYIEKDKINKVSFDIKDNDKNIRTSIIYDLYNNKLIKSKYSNEYEAYITKAIKAYKECKYTTTNPNLGEPIDLNKYDHYTEFEEYLENKFFKTTKTPHTKCDQSNCYEMELSKNEYIAVKPTNKGFYYTKIEDNLRYDVAYIRNFNDQGMLSIMSISKRENNELSFLIYDFNTDTTAGEVTEKDKKVIKRIVELYKEQMY